MKRILCLAVFCLCTTLLATSVACAALPLPVITTMKLTPAPPAFVADDSAEPYEVILRPANVNCHQACNAMVQFPGCLCPATYETAYYPQVSPRAPFRPRESEPWNFNKATDPHVVFGWVSITSEALVGIPDQGSLFKDNLVRPTSSRYAHLSRLPPGASVADLTSVGMTGEHEALVRAHMILPMIRVTLGQSSAISSSSIPQRDPTWSNGGLEISACCSNWSPTLMLLPFVNL